MFFSSMYIFFVFIYSTIKDVNNKLVSNSSNGIIAYLWVLGQVQTISNIPTPFLDKLFFCQKTVYLFDNVPMSSLL